MTDRQEKILAAALELFANDGFNATPTIKIAKKAGVSEGLIFKHFGNKKGLLNAIMKEAEQRLGKIWFPILEEQDPKTAIRMFINMPFTINRDQYDFWRLQYKLKWEKEYDNPLKLKPITDKLTLVFSQLGFNNPEEEATLLFQIIDSIGIEILRDNGASQHGLKELLLKKYQV